MTATFNLTKNQIIYTALRDINAIAEAQVPTAAAYNYASDKLNIMIKKWEAIPGINLWKRRQAYLFPSYLGASYSLGTAGYHCSNSYTLTTLSASGATAAVALTVTSISGISDGDYIGIELDDGTRQWTTVNGTPTGTTVTVTTGLTSAASSSNTIIAYTTKINRPLTILRGTTKDLINNSEVMMNFSMGYDEYFDMPVKNTPGRPNQGYYDKLISGSNPYTGTVYLYPVPNNVNWIISFTYHEPLYDMLNTTDYADFPSEWLSPLISNLRCELCPKYGKFAELKELQPIANEEFQLLKNFDGDDSSITFEL